MESTKGRVALVTGGSRGIGRAIAAALLKDEQDIRVVICARRKTEVERALEDLRRLGGERVIGQVCDVRNYDQVHELFKFVEQQFGGLDILINNAGIGLFAKVEEMSPEDWRAVIETNLNSLFYCCHEALPYMRVRGGGYIFNIGSLAGKNAFPQAAAYSASKFGLIGFSEALMQEVRYDNVRVSYIMPGSVKTSFSRLTDDPVTDELWKLLPEDVAQVIVDLLHHNPRSLPSRVEIRPSRPARK
ncbi:MAG: SDR family oxidoreductase [Acidobacteriota bacterium]